MQEGATPARITTTILTIRTVFQAVLCWAQVKVEMFQKPVMMSRK